MATKKIAMKARYLAFYRLGGKITYTFFSESFFLFVLAHSVFTVFSLVSEATISASGGSDIIMK